ANAEIFPGPFKGRERKHHANFQFNQNIHGHGHGRKQRHPRAEKVNFDLNGRKHCQRKKQFVKDVMQDARQEEFIAISEKKISGLAKFSFFSAFLSLLMVLLGVLVVSSNSASPLEPNNHHFQIGFGLIEISIIFAMLGGLSAFFSIFHFNRKRFLLIFISLLFFAATIFIGGKTMHQPENEGHRMHQHIQELMEKIEFEQMDVEMIEQFRKDMEKSCQELELNLSGDMGETDQDNQNENEPLDDDSVEDDIEPEDF
ncbi:MAG: hypothetical protein K8S87_04580, partial [Planctomycetes bacterium]|nr:hypothetical protein [Planctomycetota bacterium]